MLVIAGDLAAVFSRRWVWPLERELLVNTSLLGILSSRLLGWSLISLVFSVSIDIFVTFEVSIKWN